MAIVSTCDQGIGTGSAGYRLLRFSLRMGIHIDAVAAVVSKSEVLWKITRIGLAQFKVSHMPTFLGFVSWPVGLTPRVESPCCFCWRFYFSGRGRPLVGPILNGCLPPIRSDGEML